MSTSSDNNNFRPVDSAEGQGAVASRPQSSVLSCRILLCDDERLVLFMIANILRSAGYEVVAVSTPAEGVDALRHYSFAAVITDVMMEPVDGFAFRDMIRAQDEKIPVIFLTSLLNYDSNTTLNLIMQDRWSYFVPKSAGKAFLLNRLNQIVQMGRVVEEIDNERKRANQEMSFAGMIQLSMLPPRVGMAARYSYGCVYRPMWKVSGDTFYWRVHNPDSCTFVFGDLCGHGIHSALSMVATQTFLQNQSDSVMAQPVVLANRIQKFLWLELRRMVNVCGAIAVFDFNRNTLLYLNFGNPDMICARDGQLIDINPQQKGTIPLGLMADTRATENDLVLFQFKDDDIFIIYSDGIMDLAKTNSDSTGVSLEELNHEICRAVNYTQEHSTCRNSLVLPLPYTILGMLEERGYRYMRDDVSIFALQKNSMRDDATPFFLQRSRCILANVDRLVRECAQVVSQRYSNETLSVNVELLLQEYCCNIVNHGFDTTENEHHYMVVQLRDLNPEELELTVWDSGHTTDFTTQRFSPNHQLDVLNTELATGGRGKHIVSKIASRISITSHAGLNCAVFHIPINATSASTNS